ncbi:hypothetical protein FGIG_11259 [Fasciola gigantica]|uniref:Uncharacterized protein n=1 Tax=Fasciola gigantica TaxID=46835 RepID=A0A504YIK0_FASGI|nr:hypothetical protein FGIG_11259 [Fasciola gigantica]
MGAHSRNKIIKKTFFLFAELSTAVQSAFNKNSEISGDTSESHSPIVLQRTIVDVEQFGDKSQNSNYLDILPSIFQRTPEPAGRVDSLLLDHLQILYQNIATHLRDGVANAPKLSMKVLWRNPSGIDREFHKDYLCELTDKLKQMAYAAIDSRAKAKLAILDWAAEIPREPVRSSDHKSLRLPVFESAVVKKARGLQQSVRAWDDAWNNIRHIGRLSSLAINRENEVRTLVNYLLDDTVSVPLFVYSVSTADRNPNERNIATDDVASAVASAAFLEAQNIHSKSSNTVLIGRIVTRQVEIPQFLQSLADQLSVALCTDRDKFDPTTLTSLISSVGIQEAVHSENRILLILGGVQQIVDSDELNQTIPSIPLVEATYLPNKLCPGIRLILSGVVNTFTTNSDPQPIVLVPKTCLTLEISPTSVADAIEVCVGTLAKNNRMLTGDQITTVHQSLSRLEGRSDLLNCSFLLAQCLFTQLRSNESIDSDVIIRWVNDAGFSALIGRYCPYFSLNLIFQMINCLRLASLTVGNESQSGLTGDELHDLLLFDRQVQKDRKNIDSLHPGREINSTTLLDPAERVLLLQALSQWSMLLCANTSPVEQYLDGYLRFVLDSNSIVFESTHPIQGDGAMTDEVLDSWYVTLTTPGFHGNNNLSPDDHKSTALLKLGNQVDEETYFRTSSSLGLEYNTRYLRQIGYCLLQKGDLLEWASHTWFSYSWLYCTLFSIGSYGLLDMFPQKDCPLLLNNVSGSLASIHFQSVLVCEALMNSAHLLQNHPNLLAAEMIGQLLPFESSTKAPQFPRLGIDALLEQCRAVGAWYNAIQPVHTYSDIPGNPMIGRFPCPSSVLDMCIQGHSKLNEILLKLDDDPVIYRFACSSLKRLPDCEAGYGRMFSCPNGKYAVISDSAQSGTIKVYQMDTNTQGRVPLIGQINTEEQHESVGSYILIFDRTTVLSAARTTNPDVCHDESADWTSGVGLPKSLLLVLAQTTPPRLSIQKMIVGLCDTSPHKSIYYMPTRSTVYDEHCGRFYTVPDCQAQIDLRQLETVELFDCSYIWERSASSSGHILCHGYIQTEHVWVFSLVQCIYLVNPILGDLCGLIDVHHPISFVSVNGDKLYVGCADGYVLTYHVNLTAGCMKPDENERPSTTLSCTLVKSNSDSKFSNLGLQGTGEMRRTRTWDHDLEVTPNTEGSVHNALDLTNLETVSASLRNFRHQFTISKAKTCLLM